MSKKNRNARQNNEVRSTTSWEAILGPGYTANNVAYDFGQSDKAAIVRSQFAARAARLNARAAGTRRQIALVGKLEAEVKYVESFRYTADLIAGWWKRNWASAAVLFFIGGIVGWALIQIMMSL